jgi:hypothetical protein
VRPALKKLAGRLSLLWHRSALSCTPVLVEQSKPKRCTECGETSGLYASGICEWCESDQRRSSAVEAARSADEHAPQSGGLYDATYTAEVLAAWDRAGQPEMHPTIFGLPESWRACAQHSELLELDFAAESGAVVTLHGRAVALPDGPKVLVSAGSACESAGLELWDVAGVLAAAVLDGRIGSDTLREAVERGWSVGPSPANGAGQ